jgi:hypothetical protein
MDHGHITRSLLRRRESLEKSAFIGQAIAGSGRFALRAAENQPLGTAMTVGSTAAFAPMMAGEALKTSPEAAQKKLQRRLLAQQLRTNPMKIKTGSVISADEARRGLQLRRALEKTAGKSNILGGMADILRGAASKSGKTNIRTSAPSKPRTGKTPRWSSKPDTSKGGGGKGGHQRMSKIDALFSDPAKAFQAAVAISAGTMLTAGVGVGAAHAMGKGTEMVHKGRASNHYNKMLKADPSLRGDSRAKKYFNVLHQASPFLATNPHVAAATVRSMLDAPEGYALHPKFMREVLDIEEKRQKTRYPALRTPALRGTMPDLD